MTTSTLSTPIDGLLATSGSRLPYQANVFVRSFLLQRPGGNTIIYNSPGITNAAATILDAGGATRLLINHGHEGMYGKPSLDVRVLVHSKDRVETESSLPVAEHFTDRHMIGDDLEAIPTPGHTPGTTCYLWNTGQHRFLFTGDFIWLEHGQWKAVILDEDLRRAYLNSLALVRDIEFDVLVPWGATDDGPCIAHTTPTDIRRRIDAIIERVGAGANR